MLDWCLNPRRRLDTPPRRLANTLPPLDRPVYETILCQRSIVEHIVHLTIVTKNVASFDLDSGTTYSAHTNTISGISTELSHISTASRCPAIPLRKRRLVFDLQDEACLHGSRILCVRYPWWHTTRQSFKTEIKTHKLLYPGHHRREPV